MPEPSEDDIARQGKSQPGLDLRKTTRFPAAEVVTNQVADSILENNPYPINISIGFNSNFNMTAPAAWRWDEALKKLPYYVHIAPFVSEMAEYADLVLPATTFMEEYAYDQSPPGSGFAEIRIKQPAVKPMSETRSITDIVFEIARRLGGTAAQSFANIGDDAQGFIRYRTGTLAPWEKLQEEGVWVGPPYQYYKYDCIFRTPSQKFEFRSGNLEALLKKTGQPIDKLTCLPHYEEAEFLGDINNYPLLLSSYQPLLNVDNGSQNYPWAQEIFLVMHGTGWTNFVEINSRTAHAMKVQDGDMVWVESPFAKIKTRARVFEGIHPQVVTIASGQGHYAYGKWASGIGVNPNEITGVAYDRLSGQAAFFNTRVNVYKA